MRAAGDSTRKQPRARTAPRELVIPERAVPAGKKRGRKRTGTLVYTKRDGWIAVVPVKVDGEIVKEREKLGTHHEGAARAKMARVVGGLEDGTIAPADAATEAGRAEYLSEACERVQELRKKNGITSTGDALGRLRRYAYPECRDPKTVGPGPYPRVGRVEVTEIDTTQINAVLDYCRARGKSRQTIQHLKQDLANVFAALAREGAIPVEANPVDRAALPTMAKEVQKERAVLTDAELGVYLAYEHPQELWRMAILETQTMACISRMFGGVRTGDLHSLRWEVLDVTDGRFGFGRAPRQKTRRPQLLEIPEMLRPILRDWWERHGRPVEGLVFPTRRGKRLGEAKIKVSHARAFRRDLMRAFGIERWDAKKEKYVEARKMTARERELFTDTAETLRVDFHSWRRAYSQALADAGVNVQQATALAGHATLGAHQRYLASSGTMKSLPAAALPKIEIRGMVLEVEAPSPPGRSNRKQFPSDSKEGFQKTLKTSGADGTRTRGLRRDSAEMGSAAPVAKPHYANLQNSEEGGGPQICAARPKETSDSMPRDGATSSGSLDTILAEFVRRAVAEAIEPMLECLTSSHAEGPPPLLDRAGLARALGVSLATVGRLIRAGCPFLLVLDSRRFEIEPVKAWLRSQTPGAGGSQQRDTRRCREGLPVSERSA